MVLLIVAIALSLAAAEGRDERDVLVAIGARPPTMRKVAAYKAAVLTVGGALLAIPIGFLPIAAVLSAGHSLNTRTKQLRFPWQLTVGLVIVIPLIASFVAWVGSWIAQTARPTKMSTLSND